MAKRSWLFCTLLACFALVAVPALTTPAAAAPDPVFKVYTERIEPAQGINDSTDTVKRFAARIVFSSFTTTTRASPGASAGYGTHCPAFLIGASHGKRPAYRALAVPWCHVSR